MRLVRTVTTAILGIAAFICATAQEVVADSVVSTSGDNNRNVLMNAASVSQPRPTRHGAEIRCHHL